MYAKLFARITESSLMEEEIPVRYLFVMLLAIADPKGYVIGTDLAIARRLNMPLEEFRECLHVLMEPDEDSNSKEAEGRRIIPSDCERGYKVVNYQTYRDARDEEQRREYMREYMQDYRKRDRVNTVNTSELPLAKAEEEEEAKEKKRGPSGFVVPACFESIDGFAAALAGWIESRKKSRKPPTGLAIQLLINRLAEKPTRAVEALHAAIERGWLTVKWEWLDNHENKTTPTNRDSNSTRNIGPNAGLDYSQRPAKTTPRISSKTTGDQRSIS